MIVGRAHFDHAGDDTGGIFEQSAIGADSANGIMLTENDHWVDVINALGFDQEAGAAAPVKPIKSLQAAPRRTHAPEEKRAGAESRFGTLPKRSLDGRAADHNGGTARMLSPACHVL